jgi:hypothetical protein
MPNNGGEWFYKLPDDLMEAIGRRLNQLPILLEVKYKGKKFGFVHADLPVQDWELAKEMLEQGDYIGDRSFEDYLLWSRGIIDDYENTGKTVNIAQVDNVFLGHTVLKEVTQVGNGTDKYYEYSQTSLADNVTSTATLSINTNYPAVALGIFSISSPGSVAVQIRSEVNGSAVSIRPTSILSIRKV